jgi:hypothetical protein
MTKIIWTYWQQGWDQAPSLVKRCHASWVRLNPDYQIYALDQNSLSQYVTFPPEIDLSRGDLTLQKIAVLTRLALLARHGGVWVDATVFCMKPLSEWLGDYYQSDFFAFRNPRPDCLLSNWFLAAEPDSVILQRLHRNFITFFAEHYFSNQNTDWGEQLLERYGRRWCTNLEKTIKWHSRFARDVLRVYPYFIFHYTFNKLILSDPECAELWNRALALSAEPPHRLQWSEWEADGIDRAKREIDSGATPLYKLNWRVDSSNEYWTAVLEHLEARTCSSSCQPIAQSI